MENKAYQRKGVSSNTQVGKEFENEIFNFLKRNGISVETQKKVEIGINAKKEHAFDFGNNSILVECKSQTWTETGNAPSAKIKNWSDAMFSFYLAPKKYKKIFFVEMSSNQKYCKTLLEYFIDHYFYLIPSDVILIDYYTKENNFEVYMYDSNAKIHIHKNKDDFFNCLK
jgi:hypothetical protein